MTNATETRAPGSGGTESGEPELVARLLESRAFEKTPALRALLKYLWEHREEAISEYAIATEAMGRAPGFDAKTDATIRVQISRLRQRLEKFYEDEGKEVHERIVIPLGSHQIQIVQTGSTAEFAGESPLLVVREEKAYGTGGRGRNSILMWCGVVLLLTVCAAETWLLSRRSLSPQTPVPVAARFWKDFFANGQPTRIVLPTPVFFSFPGPAPNEHATVMYRDTNVNEFSEGRSTPAYGLLERMMGKPSLADNYTVTSDTFASLRLARYLDRFGLHTTVESSANAPMEALDSENVVAIGTWGTLTPFKAYLDQMDFELSPHEANVRIRNPEAGEPRVVEGVEESPDQGIWPGVVAVLPGRNGRTRLLVLASRHTSALVTFLTSTNGLDQLTLLWKAKGSPEYYQLVVNAELNGRGLVRCWPVALHPFKNPA